MKNPRKNYQQSCSELFTRKNFFLRRMRKFWNFGRLRSQISAVVTGGKH